MADRIKPGNQSLKKFTKISSIIVGSLIGIIIIIVLFSAIIYSPVYMYRVILNGESKVTDYKIFPARLIKKSSSPYKYSYNLEDNLGELEVNYQVEEGNKTAVLSRVLEENNTTSMIVIHDDKVIYEKYLNGYRQDSINTSFSSVKSLDSLLIGTAIDDGFIDSEDQPIADFIPEFKGTEFESITIKNLLTMRSKIHYEEGFAWFTDDAKTYYMPDLRDLALNHMKVDKQYSGQFHYNNYHPLLLGIIIERTTKQHVSDYFQEKIWEKIGAENDASWSLDSNETGFEKMESGLNFIAIDYTKIGSMLLHDGLWNGQQILNSEWIKKSVIAPAPLTRSDIDSDFLKNKNVGYQYMWYSFENDKGGHDFFASGKYGQYIYVSPENNTVIVRTGKSAGEVTWWPDIFKQVASFIGA